MTSKYYQAGEQRAQKVHELFDAIARRYDLMNDVQSFGLHRYWKRKLVELARVKTGERALDLCCGTGDLTLSLAAAGAQATGLDFSEPMMAEARKKATNAKGAAATFVTGDALQLPFPAQTFDIVTVGYGLRNLSSWETGLAEMIRVGRPGARLLVLEFGKPDNALWRGIYFGYLQLFVPLCGLVFTGNPAAYSYILESLKHYPGQRGVESRMQSSGLVNVRVVSLLGGAMSINYGEKPR